MSEAWITGIFALAGVLVGLLFPAWLSERQARRARAEAAAASANERVLLVVSTSLRSLSALENASRLLRQAAYLGERPSPSDSRRWSDGMDGHLTQLRLAVSQVGVLGPSWATSSGQKMLGRVEHLVTIMQEAFDGLRSMNHSENIQAVADGLEAIQFTFAELTRHDGSS